MNETTDPTSPARSRAPRAERRDVDSLVLVSTGDGTGKSTAAFGTVLRAVAREAWRAASEALASGQWQLVVLDEVTYPMTYATGVRARRGIDH